MALPLGVLSRHWKILCLLLVVFFVGYLGLYPLVLSSLSGVAPLAPVDPNSSSALQLNNSSNRNNNSNSSSNQTNPDESSLPESPPVPAFRGPTKVPTRAPTEFPFAASRHAELPRFVNFSHRTDLQFDATQAPDGTILVYDVQWVTTVSAIVVLISDRIVPNTRVPPSLGMML